eukprot:2316441-Alexandrium_andersonii.AAC.1
MPPVQRTVARRTRAAATHAATRHTPVVAQSHSPPNNQTHATTAPYSIDATLSRRPPRLHARHQRAQQRPQAPPTTG